MVTALATLATQVLYELGLYSPCSRHCSLHQAGPASSLKLFASKILQFAHTRTTPPLPFPSAITVRHREPEHSSGFGQSWIHDHIQHFPHFPGANGSIWLQALLNPSCTPVPPDSPVPPPVPCHHCSSLAQNHLSTVTAVSFKSQPRC